MSKEYLVNAYLRRSNKNKQSRTKVACFSNFKMYHDFPVSILNWEGILGFLIARIK